MGNRKLGEYCSYVCEKTGDLTLELGEHCGREHFHNVYEMMYDLVRMLVRKIKT